MIDATQRAGIRTRVIVFVVIACALATLFARLGVWQLDRLAERRALNAEVAARLVAAPITIATLPRDSAAMRFRRVQIRGVLDYAREITVTQRTRSGSPGVHLLTPLRIPGQDTAWLVNRGWVYSPNGKDVDHARWREADTADVLAFALPLTASPPGAPQAGTESGRVMRTIDLATLRADLPYAVAPVQLIQLGDTAPGGNIPPRLIPPPPSEGSHKSYAVQWFSFATIALLGAGIFAYTDFNRHKPRVDNT
jgi:surfeit locus 1 family protein